MRSIYSVSTIVAAAACLGLGDFSTATRAAEMATAQLSLDSVTGPTYNYHITLTNTGNTDIGTFWYAWIPSPEEDFLYSYPSVASSPEGWYGYSVGSGPYYGDGYSIEWYNYSDSSLDLMPGDSFTFNFSSPDSPAALAAKSQVFPDHAVATSYIYIGQAFAADDPGVPILVAPTPEPASLGLFALGAGAALRLRGRPKRA